MTVSEAGDNLLRQLILENQILYETACTERHFLEPYQKRIFSGIKSAAKKWNSADVNMIAEEAGVPVRQVDDLPDLPFTANWKYYEAVVLEGYRRRALNKLSARIKEWIREGKSGDVLTKIEDALVEISVNTDNRGIAKVGDLIPAFIKKIEERYKNHGELPGIPSGYPAIDDLTFGFKKSTLTYIGGRPSYGKSAFLLNVAANVAHLKIPVGFISIESSGQEVMSRLYGMQGEIDTQKLESGMFGKSYFDKIMNTSEMVSQYPMYIYDKANTSITDIKSQAKRMVSVHGIKILFVDYLQIISTDRKTEKRDRIERCSLELKNIARELEIPVVSAAQMRRDSEDRRPTLSDFSDSSQIEKDADIAILLYPKDETYWFLVAKNRDGRTGDVPMKFDKEHVRFHGLTYSENSDTTV